MLKRIIIVASLSVAAMPLAAQKDPRVGLRAGKYDAETAISNMRLLSATQPPPRFVDGINSDMAFFSHYVVQGSFNGYQIWDISNPSAPKIRKEYFCPASQSDVSVYKNLLFVSAESNSARLDCGDKGVADTVSHDRIRGIRIFDISDLDNPKYIANVQTCRGSHTHSLLVDPKDKANVYIYISGSSGVRSPSELAGCTMDAVDKNPNSALMRIEIIKVPLANPAKAAIVATPRIFHDLKAPPTHGMAYQDSVDAVKRFDDQVKNAEANLAKAKQAGMITAKVPTPHPITGQITVIERAINPAFVKPLLDSIMHARGGTGTPSGADTAALQAVMQSIVDKINATPSSPTNNDPMAFTQCHDITLYPTIGLAGGACEGHGLLLDISNPVAPIRLDAVDDKNFSYWHSATFNNDGTKVLFSDEWGGGGGPKCRATDPKEWGADAIFAIGKDHKLSFKSYYKLPAPQTSSENCVAHNGSLIPIPGRDVMIQAWYQGGISLFDWTDASNPKEIGFFDRGPVDSTALALAGSWSVYWYNGHIVSSEIVRGLDVLELTPSQYISQNEIDAAKTIHADYLNIQDQPKFVWPPSFSLSRAYVDQLERSSGLSAARITAIRGALTTAESQTGAARKASLTKLATSVDADAKGSPDAAKVSMLAKSVRALAK